MGESRILVIRPHCGHCGARHGDHEPCMALNSGRRRLAPSPRLDQLDGDQVPLEVTTPEHELTPGWGRRERGGRRW